MTQDQGRFWRYWFPKPGTSSTICNSNCFTEIPLTCSNRIVENLIQGYLDVHITDRFVSKIFHPCHSPSYCGKTRKNKERNGRTKMGRGKLENCSMEVGICNSKESGILEERCLILDLIVISRIVDDLSIEYWMNEESYLSDFPTFGSNLQISLLRSFYVNIDVYTRLLRLFIFKIAHRNFQNWINASKYLYNLTLKY